ncbi:OprD family outer membrane porin [Endozoicomonas acroporae]|uniref:OprD family outer membrane porin n=1 Tax=Endozoicomonas acroporae TaxID=1701104 RepID=UPI0013D04DED|nr:OprD family outer membrane porin [Endozoicomonas acroporae]
MAMFKKTTLATAILLAGVSSTAFAADMTDDSMYNAAKSTGNTFFDDASVTGGLYTFMRKRDRYSQADGKMVANLDHTTALANVDFSSGYINDMVGFDFGVFAAADLTQNAAVDHEFNFVPWDNPYDPIWANDKADNGASIYKAALKFKMANTWAKAGYIQPSGPGGLGVNWNFMPGTYRGAQAGADFGSLSVAYMWADEYKAPWFQDTYAFRTKDAPAGMDDVVDYVHSFGAKYTFENGLILDGAFSQSKDYLDTYHGKIKHNLKVADGNLFLAYHYYGAEDAGDYEVYDGKAWMQAVQTSFSKGAYTFRAEATITKAEGEKGYFVYRTTGPNGSSQGAMDLWWDGRSDWNHDGEKAVFIGAWRDLADLGKPGWSVGASYIYGWDGKPASDYADQSVELKEEAFNLDVAYTFQDGDWKGTRVAAHMTKYNNRSGLDSWTGFKNAFQDENDLKLSLVVPYSF